MSGKRMLAFQVFPPMKKSDKRLLAVIKKHGFHIITVIDPEEIEPRFTYSIGLTKSFGIPEVIIFAVTAELGIAMAWKYKEMATDGTKFKPGNMYDGLIGGDFPVCIGSVRKPAREELMTYACWYYGSSDFRALQIVIPTTTGIWPWEPEASDWFRENQPILNRNCIPAVGRKARPKPIKE